MHRCSNCGSTDTDNLEPLDNGALYCDGCDKVTWPEDIPRPRYEPPTKPRRDTDD